MSLIKINNHNFVLHPTGAIFWEEKKTLFLADIHLGKVAHFRKNGIAVPRKAEGLFYEKITKLLKWSFVSKLLSRKSSFEKT